MTNELFVPIPAFTSLYAKHQLLAGAIARFHSSNSGNKLYFCKTESSVLNVQPQCFWEWPISMVIVWALAQTIRAVPNAQIHNHKLEWRIMNLLSIASYNIYMHAWIIAVKTQKAREGKWP